MFMKNARLEHMAAMISRELEKPLPGERAQYRMAPSSRRLKKYPPPEKEAAVLILLFPSDDDIFITFIRRAEYEGAHSGQISFPGGMVEMTDLSMEDTARRETAEETGIDPLKINLIGKLTPLAGSGKPFYGLSLRGIP